MMTVWLGILLATSTLILLNALYVAAEFATVSARRSRLAEEAEAGDSRAAFLLSIVENPHRLDAYIAACQIGITVSSLVLGFYGQSQIARRLAPVLAGLGPMSEVASLSISTTAVLLILTFVQVLFGELAPKNVAIQYPERLALTTVWPMRWSLTLFRPLIWLFNGSGLFLMRLAGVHPVAERAHVHSATEIAMLVDESRASGSLSVEEHRLLHNMLEMDELLARHVMVPRTRMLAASLDTPCHDLLALLADSPYSRLPLYRGSLDDVAGMVHLRDLLCLSRQAAVSDILPVLRPVHYVPETMPASEVMKELQRNRRHLAIVLDEHGGTAGMLTLEDLLEEIFGELQDEFDAEIPCIQVGAGGWLWIRGDMRVEELNAQLGLELPTPKDVDTLGGLVVSQLGHVPEKGEEVSIAGQRFRVQQMAGKWVKIVGMAASEEHIRRVERGRD